MIGAFLSCELTFLPHVSSTCLLCELVFSLVSLPFSCALAFSLVWAHFFSWVTHLFSCVVVIWCRSQLKIFTTDLLSLLNQGQMVMESSFLSKGNKAILKQTFQSCFGFFRGLSVFIFWSDKEACSCTPVSSIIKIQVKYHPVKHQKYTFTWRWC